jgi:hypothetical protein
VGWLPLVPHSMPKPAPLPLIPGNEISDLELANVIRMAGLTRVIDVAAQVEAAE